MHYLSLRHTEPIVDVSIVNEGASLEDGTTGGGAGVKGNKVGIS